MVTQLFRIISRMVFRKVSRIIFRIFRIDIFLPHFFSFAIESYIYETDFTLKKCHF